MNTSCISRYCDARESMPHTYARCLQRRMSLLSVPEASQRCRACYCVAERLHVLTQPLIHSAEAERLAAELARQTVETKTRSVTKASAIASRACDASALVGDWRMSSRRSRSTAANLPSSTPRPADEILGYDDHGLPS